MHTNCDSRISPVKKYHEVLSLLRNTDVDAFQGVDQVRDFLREFGPGEKNAYMDAVTFLSMAELDGRLTVIRTPNKSHYTTSHSSDDVFKIDVSIREDEQSTELLEPGTFVDARGNFSVILSSTIETVVQYEVRDQDGDIWFCPGDEVTNLDAIKSKIQS